MDQYTETRQRRGIDPEALQQRLEGYLRARVRKVRAVEIKTDGIFRACRRFLQPYKLRCRIDVPFDQPGAGQPIHPRAPSSSPPTRLIVLKLHALEERIRTVWFVGRQ